MVAPSRVRELKQTLGNNNVSKEWVAPSRVRELKLLTYDDEHLPLRVAPSRVRELKLGYGYSLGLGVKSHLHGCVN